MLIAMMAPTIVPAFYHIRHQQLRRAPSTFDYVLRRRVWCGVDCSRGVILAIALGVMWWAPNPIYPQPLSGFSPWCGRHRLLNNAASTGLTATGHSPRLGPQRTGICFGWACEHGLWCIGSCWAVMLFPSFARRTFSSRCLLLAP